MYGPAYYWQTGNYTRPTHNFRFADKPETAQSQEMKYRLQHQTEQNGAAIRFVEATRQ
jgi:hypothetical protein